ncbi:Ankyrin repeat-containing domain protein, partial [Lactarius tabidus]
LASSKGNFDILRLLLAHGADAFVRDNNGRTPLHLAVVGAHLEVIRMLLERKAKGNLGIFWLLLAQGADAFKFASGRSVRDNNGNTPLHLAVIGGHLEVARMLLECKADVNSRNEDGSTPLLI